MDGPNNGSAQMQPHRDLPVLYLPGGPETELPVEPLGAALARYVTGEQFPRSWSGPYVLDQTSHRTGTVPLALMPGVDHQPPQEVLPVLCVVVEHYEADERVARVDRPEPRVLLDVCLGYRDGIGRDEVFLVVGDPEFTHGLHGVGRHLAQRDLR